MFAVNAVLILLGAVYTAVEALRFKRRMVRFEQEWRV